MQGDLDALQTEMESGLDSSTWIMIVLGALSVMLLAMLAFVLLKNKQQPVPPMPPYMYGPPRRPRRRPPAKKKKATASKKKKSQEKDKTINKETVGKDGEVDETAEKVKTEKEEDTPPVQKQEDKPDVSVPVMDDPNVIRSEIDDIRKSVVSMSVGQPDRTTTIVKEWLEQPAPAAPEAAEAPAESGEEAGEG